ncbi:MAG: tRNA (cytidine(34)-2'-O)-methyltransferase [Pseudobdellovibrionaceae bacterium]
MSPPFKVVLIEPEIPQNTGCIGRTCVATQSELHIVGPTGFAITDKNLKRAGLDYWAYLKWFQYANFLDWKKQAPPNRVFYFSAKAEKDFYQADFLPGDTLVFGKESKGLDPAILQGQEENTYKIPILTLEARSLNLATSVAVVLYEALRQNRTR